MLVEELRHLNEQLGIPATLSEGGRAAGKIPPAPFAFSERLFADAVGKPIYIRNGQQFAVEILRLVR